LCLTPRQDCFIFLSSILTTHFCEN
jgi:hypothetical protein